MPTPLWMDNLRVNRRLFDMNHSIAGLPHRKANWRAAICIGTGPSLERNFSVLAGRGDDVLAICCETAYKFLVERGVIPDIVVTAEEQMPVALAFSDLASWYPSCALAASTTSCSFGLHLARAAGAHIHFYNNAHPMLINDGRYVVGKLPRRVPALTSACGSILFHAVALARWIGITDVALMGADFGVEVKRADNGGTCRVKTHAGTWQVDDIPPEAINQSFDWHMRELDARPLRPLRIVNCTEGGRLELFPKSSISEWLGSMKADASNRVLA